jgi:hypothetical protein
MGKFSLKPETIERISAAQTNTIQWTRRDSMIIEAKALKTVLNANPPEHLKTHSERRLIDISYRLGLLTEDEARHLTRNVLRAMTL